MYNQYFYYIFSGIEIGKIHIAFVNRWKWIANNKLEVFPDIDVIEHLNLVKMKTGIYSPAEDNFYKIRDFEIELESLGFSTSNDFNNYINNLYPHNHDK
jgi:hypothetical protein